MRRLVELPVCLLDDLTDAERSYLTGQRHRILGWCAEMTGWVVEQRREGLALVAADEEDSDLPFPRLRAVDFTALMLLEELRARMDGDRLVGDDDVDAAASEVRARHVRAMTKELTATSPCASAAWSCCGRSTWCARTVRTGGGCRRRPTATGTRRSYR